MYIKLVLGTVFCICTSCRQWGTPPRPPHQTTEQLSSPGAMQFLSFAPDKLGTINYFNGLGGGGGGVE